jgi:hypothetical protein
MCWIAEILVKQNANREKEKKLQSYTTYRDPLKAQASRNRFGGGVEPPGVAALLVPTSGVGEEPVPATSSATFFTASASAALFAATSSAAFIC